MALAAWVVLGVVGIGACLICIGGAMLRDPFETARDEGEA